MITFEIQEKEYTIPDYLSIDNYIKVYKLKDFMDEKYFQAKLVSTVTGVDMDTLLQTNHNNITYISDYISGLFPKTDYPFIDSFTLDGIEYGFIPSWKGMSFAEFVDLDTLMNKKTEEIINNLHIICAIMYRPIINRKNKHNFQIEKYDAASMIERAELFRTNLDVKYVLGGNFFFSRFVSKYSNYIPQSLIQKVKMKWKVIRLTWKYRKIIWKHLLNRRSDGLQLSTELALTILQNTKP